uniref:Uncharacterized protein n=1 Tax=Sphaerodactylus townsendi TaxID=933632 RepID=A0ACB8F3Z1_9SAUR
MLLGNLHGYSQKANKAAAPQPGNWSNGWSYSSQTAYTTQKEAEIYEKSLPTYEQVQMKGTGASECLGVRTASDLLARVGEGTQLIVQAKAEVHMDSESNGGIHRDPESQRNPTSLYHQPEVLHRQAPLASLQEDMDTSSVESTSNSPFLQRCKDTPNLCSSQESQLRFKLPSYEDFALIDSLMRDGQGNEKTAEPNKNPQSDSATTRDGALPLNLGAGLLESRFIPNVEEGDLYYGIYEESEDILVSVGAVFEPKDLLSTMTGERDS